MCPDHSAMLAMLAGLLSASVRLCRIRSPVVHFTSMWHKLFTSSLSHLQSMLQAVKRYDYSVPRSCVLLGSLLMHCKGCKIYTPAFFPPVLSLFFNCFFPPFQWCESRCYFIASAKLQKCNILKCKFGFDQVAFGRYP